MFDGSYHRWLGEDGPQFTLLLAVDDATGCVVNALFCEQENTRSYLLLMRDLIRSYGIPLALYSDRHGVFKHTPPSETAAAPTQFSRAMGEIGVQLIFARSPQAKGRVERTAGTLQDRLVTELRLAGATTIDDANRVLNDFLPRFNERFRVPPEHADTAYRVPDPGMCLDTVLCLKYRRSVGRDNTVKYRWRTLQLLPDKSRPSYAGSVVEVLEGLDGRLAVQHEGRTVAFYDRGVVSFCPPPASASTAKYPAQLRHADRAHGWSQPLHQQCHQEVGGRGDVNGHNARSGQTPRRCRPQRRRKSSQDCDSAIQKAHPTSDGEMEGGPEGEAQGAVHPWDRPGTEHTQRHREEVHRCRKPTHVARPRNVGSALIC